MPFIVLTALVSFALLVTFAIFLNKYRLGLKAWREDTTRLIRKGIEQSHRDYTQVEALFSIFSVLKITYPLPEMAEWAVNPDFAKKLIAEIILLKPGLILEAGSSVSTLIAAYALKLNRKGRLVTLEYHEDYARNVNEQLVCHGLSEIAKVVYAPLKDYSIKGRSWKWYATPKIDTQPVDMMIVDGPPALEH